MAPPQVPGRQEGTRRLSRRRSGPAKKRPAKTRSPRAPRTTSRREYLHTAAWHEARAFSSAIKVTGGSLVFLAGMSPVDAERRLVGKGDFDAQVEQVWENIRAAVKKAGGTLADVVAMTVFLTDMRHGNRFIELRQKKFGRNFPTSALIGINHLAVPGMLVEIQAIAALA